MVTPKLSRPTVKAAWVSLVLSVVILIFKFGAYGMTHSQGVLSDALESIVNVVTAMVALKVMRAVAEPADLEHPYGHGKLEYFSSAFEGGLIAFAALAIAFEAVRALIHGHQVREIEFGFLVVAAAALINLFLGLYLRSVAKKHNSEALKASSGHVLADVLTTVGVMFGLLLVHVTGWQWVDPAVALVVAVLLGISGSKIVRKAAGGLIDEVDVESLIHLCMSLNKHRKPGLIDVHNARIIRSGGFHHVDAHLVVPDFWDALKVHTEAHEFEKQVVDDYPLDGEFAFHVDPCRREYCSHCDLDACPIRRLPFQGRKEMTVHSVTQGPSHGVYE